MAWTPSLHLHFGEGSWTPTLTLLAFHQCLEGGGSFTSQSDFFLAVRNKWPVGQNFEGGGEVAFRPPIQEHLTSSQKILANVVKFRNRRWSWSPLELKKIVIRVILETVKRVSPRPPLLAEKVGWASLRLLKNLTRLRLRD